MKLDPNFSFRGTRDYLHSTSLFNDLLQLRGRCATGIDMKFHRRTGRQVSYTDESPVGDPIAEWSDSGGKLFVVEREEQIVERVPYDEDGLAAQFKIEGRVARIPADLCGFTQIEALVAGFKRLLQSVHQDERKYAFVRIRLDHCPEAALEIRYSRDIGAFFQGNIYAQGEPVGQIFFGVWG